MFNSVFYRVAGPACRIFVLSAQAKNSPVGFDFSPPGLPFSIIRISFKLDFCRFIIVRLHG